MNIEALYITFFFIMSILCFIKGVKTYLAKDIDIKKFVPNYNKEPIQKKVKKEKVLSQSKTTIIIIAGGLSTGVLVYGVVGNIYISAFSSLSGLIFPKLWHNWYSKSQDKLVSMQMEKVAETMAVVLKTENNIVAALERAALDCEEPLKSKLNKTAQEISLGIPTNTAFDTLSKCVDVPEMMIVSIGIELQQQGMAINMASMFEQVQKNIRNRQSLKDELAVMTTENKMAGWIVAVIPLVSLTLIRMASPEFTAPLFTTPAGIAVFSICLSLIALGLYWLLQIAEMKDF